MRACVDIVFPVNMDVLLQGVNLLERRVANWAVIGIVLARVNFDMTG